MMETRTLYILAIIATLAFSFKLSALAYKLGLARGQLQKMEEFKDTYIPKPSNVYPDAAGE